MDIVFEILFELIVEGSLGTVGDRKVPVWLRVLTGVFLFLLFGGIVGALVFIGVSEQNWIVVVIGALIALWVIAAVWKTIRQHRNNL